MSPAPSERSAGVHVCAQIYHDEPGFLGPKGFHLHEFGDLSEGCASAGGHYNPSGQNHGGMRSPVRHTGDFGNLVFEQRRNAPGSVSFASFHAPNISLLEVLGRAIVIHQDEDDLGQGKDAESLKTGNSGPRVACAVVVAMDPKKLL